MNPSRHSAEHRRIAYHIGLFLLFLGSLPTEAWVSRAPSLGCRKATTTALFYSSVFDRNEISNSTDPSRSSPIAPSFPIMERLRVNGVSVSPKGFHVLLESTMGSPKNGKETATTKDSKEENEMQTSENDKDTNNNDVRYQTASTVLPLKMTNDPADAYAATSPESLTLCQLLSGVDMAGTILPPELLGRIVACHIEEKIDAFYDDDDDDEEEITQAPIFTSVLNPIEGKIWQYIQSQQALMREQSLFGSSSDPQKDSSHITPMPQVTLDQLTIVPIQSKDDEASSWKCKLECALPEWKENIVVEMKADLLPSLAYNYDPESSLLFICIALALRYKAPIVLEQPSDAQPQSQTQEQQNSDSDHYYWFTSEDLNRDFPKRTTLENIQEQSTRVTQNIEKGFEIHKLTGALQIAMRMGDTKAAEKIRAKLDEHDSMEDLPTLGGEAKGGDDNASSPSDKRDRLDDLENNILQ